MSSTNASSALLDLKAELSKKQDALKQTKLQRKSDLTPKAFKLRGEERKEENDANVTHLPISQEIGDEERLSKSRAILEAKAKLYEKIVSQEVPVEDYEDEVCLVDFREKMKQNEKLKTSCSVESKNQKAISESLKIEAVDCSHLLPSSSSKKSFQEQNEKPDGPVHYQNVQFNEIRDHGVGYFAFSEVEEERQNQMKMLRDLRQQAVKKQAAHNKIQEKKKAALEARLSKICDRRNIDKSVLATEHGVSTDEVASGMDTPAVDLDNIPLPKDDPAETSAPNKKIRPWDVGKEGFMFAPPENKKRAEKWVEDQRSERNKEFAPPQFY